MKNGQSTGLNQLVFTTLTWKANANEWKGIDVLNIHGEEGCRFQMKETSAMCNIVTSRLTVLGGCSDEVILRKMV